MYEGDLLELLMMMIDEDERCRCWWLC